MDKSSRRFAHPMKVQISDVTVTAKPVGVHVTFHERWRSDGYEDSGKKLLVLMRHEAGAGPRIAHEETLDSLIVAGKRAGEISRETFMLVLDGETVLLE